MQSPLTLKKHAGLVDRMATARGLDLEEEILRGNMRIGDLEDAVLSCTMCSNPGACEGWLADAQDQPQQQTPEYCRNADLFRALEQR
ncbi:MAG: DUF6455 family protein [Pelagimonas sp.]|nr:DUF6455 family protein [Pelagimonas sp.]